MRLQIINTDRWYQRETENERHKEWPQWPLLFKSLKEKKKRN